MATKPNNWLWFFAALVVLAVLAVAINWGYNTAIQLTPAKLAAARALWAAHGPADYDLTVEKAYSARDSDGTPTRETIRVQVRGGKATSATLDGRPLPERVAGQYAMPGWYDFLDSFLKRDLAAGAPRAFRSADFDRQTGAVTRFRRRVSGTKERQELVLTVTPPAG